jgi:UDP-N-acetylglucosamine--N-acetylmuramyl-(pentapeptide) pyrophosphoryl-undecaprenol N-acetylglucosamine transferase
MRVIIAAGGTGGHLYPGLALAREFERQVPGSEIVFVGAMQGIEMKVMAREGFELVTVKARGVMGKGLAGAVRGLAVLPVGLVQCIALCRKRRPDLVLGIGGYTSPPLVLAAFLLGIKRAILEPNACPGVANRVLAPFVNLIFVSFGDTAPFFGKDKTQVVGTPIRREFLEGPPLEKKDGGSTLLIFGGSQGARSINKAMIAALPSLIERHPRLRVIHQTGERDFEEVAGAYRAAWPSNRAQPEVVPFLYDMPRALRQADLVISRSGAMTVAELTACGKPAILIPFPHAVRGHQEWNARALERAGAAQVVLDGVLTGDVLAEAVSALLADPARLAELERHSRALGRADSAEQVVTACRRLVEGVKREMIHSD